MLDFDGATRRFGRLTALDGCTFAARPGRLTGFLGPSGAGKTTAMRAVLGLAGLDAGTVRWQGIPVSAADRARFGYMPEERGLYPRIRVRDQLVYLGQLCGRAAEDVNRSVDAWLARLGLAARAADRLDAALVGEPDLLVLDEPFSGLDPIAMGAMSELLSDLAAHGAAVLFCSHQLDLVEDLCQDVVIIEHGRIVLAGRVYIGAILHTGPALKLSDAWAPQPDQVYARPNPRPAPATGPISRPPQYLCKDKP